MKNDQEKAAMTAAEKLGEALVLKPEWEVKPKSVVMTHVFSVEFNESTSEFNESISFDTKVEDTELEEAGDSESKVDIGSGLIA